MLHSTFVHIPGIGETTERKLWQAGILHWQDFKEPFPDFLSGQKIRLVSEYLAQCRGAVGQPVSWFAENLPKSQLWRLFPHYRESAAYIDIETTGLSREYNAITCITLYDGVSIFTYVQGENLEDFVEQVAQYELLVTYNGSAFDLPVLRRHFGIPLDQVHLDLRPVLQSLGYRGGLKSCEKQLGLARAGAEGIDGFGAVLLWREYVRSGDPRALNTLLAYNIEDTVNLETLLVLAYNMKLAGTPFAASHLLDLPSAPFKPYLPDPEIVASVREKMQTRHWR